MAGEIPQGIFGGAVSGASSGAAFGPPGMAIGALIGGASGYFGGKQAKKLESDYQKAEANVQAVDPAQTAFLNRLRQQERAFRAGTDPSSAFAARNARNIGSTTQANLMRAGGPGVVNNLLRSQGQLGQTMAGIGAQAAGGANQMLGMQGALEDRMSQQRLERQRYLRDLALERATGQRQNVQNMFSGALAMVPEMTATMPRFPQGGGSVAHSPNLSALYRYQPVQQMQPRMGGSPLSYQPLG